ncbi:golgin subfamily B member 1 [Microdochium nivale]|nr:golgin subfamily B member 1 [Microdochium nivale]
MASSPQTTSALDAGADLTPPTRLRLDTEPTQSPPPSALHNLDLDMANSAAGSSPLVSPVKPGPFVNKENTASSKARHSRILSGAELSPLKILSSRDDNSRSEGRSPERLSTGQRSPRKASPEKRFPVRVNQPERTPTPPAEPEPVVVEQEITLEDALKQNTDLAKAIKIFEDEDSVMLDTTEIGHDISSVSAMIDNVEGDTAGADDTMVSTFSTFSAVPNMTMFARLGETPSKFPKLDPSVPGSTRKRQDSSPRASRPPQFHESGNTSNLLMDFTDQLSSFGPRQSPMRRMNTTGNMQSAATPARRQSNLLDFDIPPLPTPRSIPTVTPRELESLKSAFLSEISSLKASLSGKEAEVASLKTAVGDAEKRVGECTEMLREAEGARDSLKEENENWERRGRDMESVLRKVKEEIVKGQDECESLESRLEESEKRREAAEIMAQEAESKMAGMRAGKAYAEAEKSPEKSKAALSREKEISAAVETAGLELHALYKSKHETKVAALKKSYEKRWEKKVKELEWKLNDLVEENESLRVGRNATTTKLDPNMSVIDEERREQSIKDSAQIKEMRAEIEQLKAIVQSVKADNADVRLQLERERIEKGELVQLAEEMMQMQSMQSIVHHQEETKAQATPVKPKTPAVPQSRTMVAGIRSSGLRAPGSMKKPTESKIGGLGHERNRLGGSQGMIARPGAGPSSRSGIMSSIEKMGSHRGRSD